MNPELTDLVISAGVLIAIFFVIFFVTRMFWLWYWKIDKIEAHLAAISSALESMQQQEEAPEPVKKASDSKYWPK